MDYFYYGAPAPFDKKPYSRATNRLGLTYFVLCLVSNVAAILLSAVYLWLHPNATAYPDWLNWTITIVSLYLIATPLSLLCLLGIPKTPPARRRISFRTFLIFALIAFALMIGGSIIGQSVNSVVESFVGIEQGEDLTEEVRSYVSKMINDPAHPETKGCVVVDERLAELLQKLMEKYTFENVDNAWLKLCYYYDRLGPNG